MTLRISGFAAILGAALVSLALWLAMGPGASAAVQVCYGSGCPGAGARAVAGAVVSLLMLPGLLALLVALGLISFQARVHPLLSWAAFTVLAVGMVAATVEILVLGVLRIGVQHVAIEDMGSVKPIGLVLWVAAATTIIGSALFGIVTYRTAVLSKGAALLFAAAAVMFASWFVNVSARGGDVSLYDAIAAAVGMVCFVAGWFALGVQAIRRDRVSTSPSARDRKSGAG